MSFLLSALPWVIYGLCVAVICANLGSRKKQEEGLGQRISLGISLGLLLGVTLNSLGLWTNHGTGLALGPLIGLTLAILYPGKKDSGEEKGA